MMGTVVRNALPNDWSRRLVTVHTASTTVAPTSARRMHRSAPCEARLRLHDDACVHDDVAKDQAHAKHRGKHRQRKGPALDLELGEIGVLAHVRVGQAVGHARAQQRQMGKLHEGDGGVQPRGLGQERAQQHICADAADHSERGVQGDVAQAEPPEANAPQKVEQAHAQAVADAADELKHHLHRGVHMTAGDAADCAGDEEHHGDDDWLVGAEDRMHALVENGTAKQHEGRGGAEGVAHKAGHDA